MGEVLRKQLKNITEVYQSIDHLKEKMLKFHLEANWINPLKLYWEELGVVVLMWELRP